MTLTYFDDLDYFATTFKGYIQLKSSIIIKHNTNPFILGNHDIFVTYFPGSHLGNIKSPCEAKGQDPLTVMFMCS